jgi:phage antirepressor YoqD-like protein
MKTYLTLEQLAQSYPITDKELSELLNDNHAIFIQQGGLYKAYDSDIVADYIAERDISPAQFDHLRGALISINEGAAKYDVANSTLSNWVTRHAIEIRSEEKNRKFVDEADLAYLVTVSKAKASRAGRKIF